MIRRWKRIRALTRSGRQDAGPLTSCQQAAIDTALAVGILVAPEEYLVIEGSGRIGGMVEMALSHAEFMLRMGVI